MGSSSYSGEFDLQYEFAVISRNYIPAFVLSKEAIPKSFFECGISSNIRERIAMVFDPVLYQLRSFIALLPCHTPVQIWSHIVSKARWHGARLVRSSGRLRRLSRLRKKLRLSRCATTGSRQIMDCSFCNLASRFALGSDRFAKGRRHNSEGECRSYRTVHQSHHH